jgi:hypothetical protein
MKKLLLLVPLLMLAVAGGCSQKGYNMRLTVEPAPVPGVDWAPYKKWNFGRLGEYVTTGNAILDDPAFRQSVSDHTVAEMSKLGYANVVSQPDMLLMFHIVVEDRYDEVKLNEVYQGYDMSWAQASSEDTWQEGTIILFAIDAKSNQQIWSCTARGELDKTADYETKKSRFKETVSRMLATFPPRPAAAP